MALLSALLTRSDNCVTRLWYIKIVAENFISFNLSLPNVKPNELSCPCTLSNNLQFANIGNKLIFDLALP